jgi:type I restriction enzyme R subunit
VKKKFIDEPGPDEAADRGRQAADRLRRAEATYLYIDKKMRDHGLFQAICRVNRLDGDDKEYGYIIDYKDLFKRWKGRSPTTPAGARRLRPRTTWPACWRTACREGREDLEEALGGRQGAVRAGRTAAGFTLQYQHYFCAKAEHGNAAQLKANEPKRLELYK